MHGRFPTCAPRTGTRCQRPRSRDIPLVAVVGATATGKSDLAITLARELDGEVVNADALQLYRGMDIGTAKVTATSARKSRIISWTCWI